MVSERDPAAVWIVRHGQSAGNVARDLAETAGHTLIEIAHRDMDVPLSELGEHQAQAVGRWFGALPPDRAPELVICSPYVRALETARILARTAHMNEDRFPVRIDERLREKEFGILDRLTGAGIRRNHPDLAEAALRVGKFYYRPPGGESWCDVLLRLRSFTDTLCRDHCGQRVLIVAHQVVVLCLRYLFEGLTEQQILEIDRATTVPNCSVTYYERETTPGGATGLALRFVNLVAPMKAAHTPITREPDVPVAPK